MRGRTYKVWIGTVWLLDTTPPTFDAETFESTFSGAISFDYTNSGVCTIRSAAEEFTARTVVMPSAFANNDKVGAVNSGPAMSSAMEMFGFTTDGETLEWPTTPHVIEIRAYPSE